MYKRQGNGFFKYKSNDLDGFHTEAIEFKKRYRGKVVQEIGDEFWVTIKNAAGNLLKDGQEEGEILKAVRDGFPIRNSVLLKDLFN